ncbi:FadR family transcriptional regulator [Frankia sp. AgB1.9]|uniref:FadR/GntR family transcriptional regulator n=1 Tax=unclassified Frankia TaxID=2632575 RepID=UPI001932F2BE|nr:MULTISPECIES: FCD domain-containing protein [unclassified Frankia]MBL7553268.1 FadR family transcriptional regulator [Frankia sp. AgB1.9]
MALSDASDRRIRPMAVPRVAEAVAGVLRSRIVNGELADGDLLPKQDDLMAEFGIARASLREVMRILETEGLVTVRRGNIGGAVVHAPDARGAAYQLGLVMQSHRVTLADVSTALLTLEPMCARLAAGREDRQQTVVPLLVALNERAQASLDANPAELARILGAWHRTLVENCGNHTMYLALAAVDQVWSYHVSGEADAAGVRNDQAAQASLRGHVEITRAIESGDGTTAEEFTRRHLEESRTAMRLVDPTITVNLTGPPTRNLGFRSIV